MTKNNVSKDKLLCTENEIAKTPKFYSLVKGNNSQMFEEYANNYANNSICYDLSYNIGGYSPKRFVRYSTEEFGHLFESLQSGQSSYVTYISDLLDENQGLPPIKTISVLRKIISSPFVAKNEEICSRIANIFGLPTVYNRVVDKFSCDNDACEVLSVDFLKKDETLVPLNEIGVKGFPFKVKSFPQVYELSDCVKSLQKSLNSYLINYPNKEEQINEITKDYIKSYFVKYLILNDADFAPRNFSLIINDKKKVAKFAPNYDYECCLCSQGGVVDLRPDILDNAINFIATNYPEVLCDIKCMLLGAVNSTRLDSLANVYKCVPNSNYSEIHKVKNRAKNTLNQLQTKDYLTCMGD